MRRVMTQYRSTRDGRQRFVTVAFSGPAAEHRYCKLSDFQKARQWEELLARGPAEHSQVQV